MTKARKRRVHRVARGKLKPGHIVAHNRRRRKGEILCHNHVLHTAATANGVHALTPLTLIFNAMALIIRSPRRQARADL